MKQTKTRVLLSQKEWQQERNRYFMLGVERGRELVLEEIYKALKLEEHVARAIAEHFRQSH